MSKGGQGIQHINWIFTFNYGGRSNETGFPQPSRESVEAFWNAICENSVYAIGGWETAPTTGQLHLQGYFQLEKKRRKTELIKLPNASTVWFDVAKGDEEANQEYCMKSGDFMEHGECRIVNGGKRERKRWKDALQNAIDGRIDLIDAQIQVQYCRNLDYISDRRAKPLQDLPHTTKHYWLWGPTGSGKSRTARTMLQDRYTGIAFYNKTHNKWWDHYPVGSPVLIDDFGKEAARCLGTFVKLWLDIYVFKAEYKGGAKDTRPPCIIITSNYHPWELWGDDVKGLYEPIMRRLNVSWIGNPGETEPQMGEATLILPSAHQEIDLTGESDL